jgi:O-acetyl-ADP-ribose deacetylase (regulator of RNase III)
MPVRVHEGTITELAVDAIVNAANTQLQHGGGVAAAIVRAGGQVIQEESDRIGWCHIGSAVATTGGSLPAKHVFHVPTIDYKNRRRATMEEIERGTRAALDLARELSCHSIAFPLLGAGVVGLPTVEVARAMLRALEVTELDVAVCAYSRSDREALREALGT